MMKIAVTAASGQLGATIAKALKTMHGPESIIGLARTVSKAQHLGIEVRPGDYTKPDQLTTSLAGVDAVLLVSGMAPPDERIQQHRNVIQAATSAGVRKIVYTSIQGLDEGTAFSSIVQSNRQTEADVRASDLEWAIGRNGIYIEPDIEYIENYRASGEIANCAAEGKCGYTTRQELAYAYAKLLSEPKHKGQTYNLHGELMTQAKLAQYLNHAFNINLNYRSMSVEAYKEDRIKELGTFIGGVIAGIYEGIRKGALDHDSDYEAAAGRPHQSWDSYFEALRASCA